MKPLSEVVPGLLVIQIPIQAVCAVSVASCFSDTHKKVSQFETSVHALFFVRCMKVILKLRMSSLLRIVLSYESLSKSHYDRNFEYLKIFQPITAPVHSKLFCDWLKYL